MRTYINETQNQMIVSCYKNRSEWLKDGV